MTAEATLPCVLLNPRSAAERAKDPGAFRVDLVVQGGAIVHHAETAGA